MPVGRQKTDIFGVVNLFNPGEIQYALSCNLSLVFPQGSSSSVTVCTLSICLRHQRTERKAIVR